MEVNNPDLNMDSDLLYCSLATSVACLLVVLTCMSRGLLRNSGDKKRFLGGVEKMFYENRKLAMCTVVKC